MARILQNVIDRVRVISGDKTSSQFLDADIARWATDAQLDIIRTTEKPQVDSVIVSVAGQYRYPVVGGFLYLRNVVYNGSDLSESTKEQIDQLNPAWRINAASPNGIPQLYWSEADAFNLYPTPDTSGLSIIASITPRPTDLVNGTDVLTVPDENFNTIVQVCLQRTQEWAENWEAASYYRQESTARKMDDAHNAWVNTNDSYPVIRSVPEDNC